MTKSKSSDNVLQVLLLRVYCLRNVLVVAENADDFLVLFIGELSLIVDGDLPEEHIILSEGASFIGEDIFDPAQLLRAVAIPGDCSLNVVVFVDEIGIEELGKIQIDSHGNGNDGAEQDQHPHELDRHVDEFSLLKQQEHYSQAHHDEEQDFRQLVYLHVQNPEFSPSA